MKKAFIYVRVSTEEQRKHGLSVDSQIKALYDYCEKNGFEVYDLYNDAGRSAHASYKKRKELLRLIEDTQLKKGSIILFTKLDRWFRSVEDYYEVMSQIPDTIPWRAIWEDYETETSAGRFKVNIMLSIAQAEAERTGERIKATFEYKRAKGDYVGTAPRGYMRQNNKLIKNPDDEEYVNLLFDTYLKTKSSTAVIKALYEKGYSISKAGVMFALKSETYRGNAYGFACEPYITEEQASKIDFYLKQNYRAPKNPNMTYIFSRLCVCDECGCKMRANYTAKNTIHKCYVCKGKLNAIKHKGFSYGELVIERFLLEELDTLLGNYKIESSSTAIDEDYEANVKRKISLENKLKRIGIRFEDGDISVEEYREKRKVIIDEMASIELKPSAKSIELPDNWKDIYVDLDEKHKQNFWSAIIKEIHFTHDRSVKPFIIFN